MSRLLLRETLFETVFLRIRVAIFFMSGVVFLTADALFYCVISIFRDFERDRLCVLFLLKGLFIFGFGDSDFF
jgi:hypothetical protein